MRFEIVENGTLRKFNFVLEDPNPHQQKLNMKAEQSTIDEIRTRPRFKILSSSTPEEYTSYLKLFLLKHSENFEGNINREAATISVKTPENNFWKPRLSLRAENEDGQTVIRGIFGPSSAVWTFFMFLYFVFGILWMVFITLWFVGKQIKSSDYHWALPLSFVMLLLILFTYLSAQFGQKKAKNEMQKLRKFAIESTLKHEKKEA